jgi:hypothetical protein
MEQNKFYNSVSGWIASCTTATQLGWIQRMVEHSHECSEIKAKLRQEAIDKMNGLGNAPAVDPANFLLDDHGHPQVYTTRFSAVCKLASLKMKGYDAELVPGDVFYRIRLVEPAHAVIN